MESLPCFGFEDEDLSETRNRKDTRQFLLYTPKICHFEWYMDENNTIPEDKVEHANLVILAGNQYFYKKQFVEARVHYERGLSFLPKNSSMSLRRRFLDGIVRCSCYLKDYDHARKLAEEMLSDSNNDDHLSSALGLLLTVFKAKGDLKGEIETLEQWIDIHPLNAHLWKELSDAYTRDIKQNQRKGRKTEDHNPLKENVNSSNAIDCSGSDSKDDVQLKIICACLVISRICLDIFVGGQSSFGRLRTSELQAEIEKEIECLSLNEVTLRNIEEQCKALAFSTKSEAGEKKCDVSSVVKCESKGIETNIGKTGQCFKHNYFKWLFKEDGNLK